MILFGFGLGNEPLYFNMGSSKGSEEELLLIFFSSFYLSYVLAARMDSSHFTLYFFLIHGEVFGALFVLPVRLCLSGALGICPV